MWPRFLLPQGRAQRRVRQVPTAAGSILWGIGFTLLGFLAGNSYKTIEKSAARAAAIAIAAVVVVALIVWRVREHRRDTTGDPSVASARPVWSGRAARRRAGRRGLSA